MFTLLRLWLSVITTNLTDNHSTQHRKKTTCAKKPVGFYFGFCCFFVCCHGDKASQQTSALEMWLYEYLHTGSACETLLIHQQKDFPKGKDNLNLSSQNKFEVTAR